MERGGEGTGEEGRGGRKAFPLFLFYETSTGRGITSCPGGRQNMWGIISHVTDRLKVANELGLVQSTVLLQCTIINPTEPDPPKKPQCATQPDPWMIEPPPVPV